MKYLLPIFLMAFSQQAPAKEYFSNGIVLPESKTLFVVHKKTQVGEENQFELLGYDSAQKKQSIELLPIQKNQDVVRIFRSKEKKNLLYFLFQIQNAGYAKPDFYSLDLETKKWNLIRGEINCVNLEKIEAKKGQLHLSCGEDYVTPPDQKVVKIEAMGIRELEKNEMPEWVENKPEAPGEILAAAVKHDAKSSTLIRAESRKP